MHQRHTEGLDCYKIIFIILMRHEDIGKPGVLWINQRVCGVKLSVDIMYCYKTKLEGFPYTLIFRVTCHEILDQPRV